MTKLDILTIAIALDIMDSWHHGRNCALAGREVFGPGACEPCSLVILLEKESNVRSLDDIIATANRNAAARSGQLFSSVEAPWTA